MAASKDMLKKNLSIEYPDGQNDKGEEIVKKFSYNHVDQDATPDNLLSVARAVGSLMPEGIDGALTVESFELSE